jgi:N-acetylglutamate synthase-like GNAT family acetyltransferase
MERLRIRPARSGDASAIAALLRDGRLNPRPLRWPAFDVAEADGAVIGAVQLRRHGRDAAALGALAVRRDRRGAGVGARLIEEALERAPETTFVVTAGRSAPRWLRRGFRRARLAEAPLGVALSLLAGQAAKLGRALRGERPRRLALLVRRRGEPSSLPGRIG